MAMISIIMPVYNTGVIIHDTIKSILNQTYTDFELLLIDDGSTDGTGIICDEYASKDSRVKVFHKTNGGICEARNYGLSKVASKYLTFCDHDDLYSEKLLEEAIKFAEKNECEVVKFGYKVCNGDTQSKYKCFNYRSEDIVLQGKELTNSYLKLVNAHLLSTVWNSIYLTDFIKKNNLLFDTRFKHGGEDINFNNKWYPLAHNIGIINSVLYEHYVRSSLSTSSKFYDDILEYFIIQMEEINRVILKMGIDIVFYKKFYANIFFSSVVGYLSYGVKMLKPYSVLKCGLNDYYKLYKLKHIKGDVKLYDMKNTVVYFCFLKRWFYCLYLMAFLKNLF